MDVSFNECFFTLRCQNGALETYLESVLWRTVRKPTSYVNTLHPFSSFEGLGSYLGRFVNLLPN
jgi:hypothetical protein